MAQTIEGFVGIVARRSPDEPDPLARVRADRGGLFLRCRRLRDPRLADPRHDAQRLRHCAADRHRGQRHAVRPVRRYAGAGRVHRPLRPQDGVSVQPAALRARHDRRGILAQLHLARRTALHCRHRARRRAAAVLRLCRRICAEEHPRPLHRRRADDRRRLVMAAVHAVRARLPRHARLARHLDRHRRVRAGRVPVPLLAAGVAALAAQRTARAIARSIC